MADDTRIKFQLSFNQKNLELAMTQPLYLYTEPRDSWRNLTLEFLSFARKTNDRVIVMFKALCPFLRLFKKVAFVMNEDFNTLVVKINQNERFVIWSIIWK